VPMLLERTADRRGEVRAAATRALGAIGSSAATPRLAALFLERKAVPTGVAYDALRGTGDAGAETFRQGLLSGDPTVRVASCFGVAAQFDQPSALAMLGRVVGEDDDDRVRIAAAKALGVVGGKTPPSVLLAAPADAEVRLRREAVRALGSFDAPAAVAVLVEATVAEDRETALRAAESLVALSGQAEAGAAAEAALAQSSSWAVEYVRTVAELTV